MNEKKEGERIYPYYIRIYLFFQERVVLSAFAFAALWYISSFTLYNHHHSPITHHRIQKKKYFQHSTFFVHFSPAHSTHSIFLLLLLLLFSWCVEIYVYFFFLLFVYTDVYSFTRLFLLLLLYQSTQHYTSPSSRKKNYSLLFFQHPHPNRRCWFSAALLIPRVYTTSIPFLYIRHTVSSQKMCYRSSFLSLFFPSAFFSTLPSSSSSFCIFEWDI